MANETDTELKKAKEECEFEIQDPRLSPYRDHETSLAQEGDTDEWTLQIHLCTRGEGAAVTLANEIIRKLREN